MIRGKRVTTLSLASMNETQQRDRQLADILQDVTEGPVEERPSLEELQQRHPHLADELQELWGA
ncbi:MAG: hypothetical protein AAF961_07735, partial [Planctomycetota bacterium]